MRAYEIKVIGYEGVAADSDEEAMGKFEKLLESGYKVSDLRWKSIEVNVGSPESDLLRQNKELVEVVKALVDRLEWLTHPPTGDTERPYIVYANRVLRKFK